MSLRINDDTVTITDFRTFQRFTYFLPRISRTDLKEDFDIVENVMLFVLRDRSRLPIIPDENTDTYELEFGVTYYVDGDRRSLDATRLSKKLTLYSPNNIREAESDVRKNCTHLQIDSLTNLTKVAYCVVQLQITADNAHIPDKPLVGLPLEYLKNRRLKGALEEIAQDIKTCFELEKEGNTMIREHAAFTIRYFKEWNQFVNIEKLRLDCSQLKDIVQDCGRKSEVMSAELEKVGKKVSELLQALHGVSGCAEDEKEAINAHKHIKEQEQAVINDRSARIAQQKERKTAEWDKLRKKREEIHQWNENQFHLFINKWYDLIIGGLSNRETYIPCRQRDQMKLHEAERDEHRQRDEVTRIQVEYERIRRFMAEVNSYIHSLSRDVMDLSRLMRTITELRNTLRSMSHSWNRYKEYFSNFLHFVNFMSEQLRSFITYNDNSIEFKNAASRVLQIVGSCTTLIAAADIYEEVSERFARPIMFHYETCLAENNGVVNQENLKRLMQQNKEEAEEYLQGKNSKILQNAIEKLRDFALPCAREDSRPSHTLV